MIATTTRLQLRDYQKQAVDDVIAKLDRRPILVSPTGSGKTTMATEIVERLGVPTLWMAHRKELIDQAADRLEAHGLKTGIVMSGYEPKPEAQVQVASIQTLVRRDKPPAGLIVIDECFPAGTLVDGVAIEHIRVGDTVTAWDEAGARPVVSIVSRTFCRAVPQRLVRFFSDGREIVCTPNHPIFAAPGRWVPAINLVVGDHVYVMPQMRRPDDGSSRPKMPDLLPTRDGRTEPSRFSSTDASGQPGLEARGPSQDQQDPPSHAALSSGKRRQRPSVAGSAAETGGGTGVGDGVRRPDEDGSQPRLALSLQDRHCRSTPDDCGGSGWELTCPTGQASAGPEERGVPCLARVDRVEVFERGRDAGFERLCPDGNVYNLEVDGVHTYTANGIVVHNCHHAAADSYQNVLAEYPDAHIVGLTATPFRLDGRGLGELFGELVVAAWPDELCSDGVLHKPRVWASKAPDLRGVRVVAGDYNLGALAQRSNTAELNADIVETWRKRAAGRRTVAFAVDIAHSMAITKAFQDAGVPAEHLDGGTPRSQRDDILDRLRSGKTLVVSNCMVLTEGWDLPALECAVVARPTASLNLHLQMIGRVMRACDGKDGAIVLDHAGNHHVHGLVTRRLNYTLSDEKVSSDDPLGLRRCGNCGLLYGLDEECCPECGWVPVSTGGGERSRPAIHGPGELAEFDDTSFEYRRQMWVQIEAQRMAGGYREGWSFYRFKDRFGVEPVVAEGDLIDPDNATYAQKRAYFKHLAEVAVDKGYKSGWASHRFRNVFGQWPVGFVQAVRDEVARESEPGQHPQCFE
jgi:superfamily II DNA or RNA helicase